MYRPQGDEVSPLSCPLDPQSGALVYSKASVSTYSVKSLRERVVPGIDIERCVIERDLVLHSVTQWL